jgi:hypothetical protein
LIIELGKDPDLMTRETKEKLKDKNIYLTAIGLGFPR